MFHELIKKKLCGNNFNENSTWKNTGGFNNNNSYLS